MIGTAWLLTLTSTLSAQDTIAKGVDYLVSQQKTDGSWSLDEKLKLIDSAESFQALLRASGGENALNKSLQFFSRLAADNNENTAYKLWALSSSTADVTALVNQLIAAQKSDGGWGIADAKQGSIPHTLLSLDALLEDTDNTVTGNAIAFLIKNQQPSGAWVFSGEYSLSDTAHTAMVLIVLKNAQNANTYAGSGLEQAIAKAQQYIQGKAKEDGSYGDLLDTAWTSLAFSLIKQPSELQTTLALIQNSQLENGSWNNKVYDTAVCLRALTAIQVPTQEDLPDLEITESGIIFNPSAPFTGNQVTISATIFNRGEADAENVKIEFFNRDPRIDGIELAPAQTVALIPAGGSVQVNAVFTATGMVGPEQIVIFIDRENNIRETTKTNNAAAKILSVGGAPDLAVSPDSIVFSNAAPQAFDQVTVTITIKNTGNEAAQNIPIRILDNNTEITTMTLSGVNPGSSNKVILNTYFTEGAHEITVEADPDHFIERETNRTNNTAKKSIAVSAIPVSKADLTLDSIVVTPNALVEGAAARVAVTVSNRGGTAAGAFEVKLTLNGADWQTFNVSALASGQKAILNLDTSFAAGNHTVAVQADPAGTVDEDNRTNNTGNSAISVRSTSSPVTEADLVAVSLVADKTAVSIGDKVILTATVKNTGMTEARNITIRLFDNDVLVGNDMTIPSLTENQSAVFQIETNFATAGSHTLRLAVDPENKITESNKTNNQTTAVVTVAETQRPDFQVTGLVFSKPTPLPGEEFTITATVKNGGNADAPVSKLLLTRGNPFIDGAILIANVDVPAIPAGESVSVNATCQLNIGTFTIFAYADSDQIIEELSKDNNLFSKEISTQDLPDLFVDGKMLSLSHTDLSKGRTVEIKAVIANVGKVASSAAKGRFLDRRVGDTTYLIGEVDIPAIPAGQSAEVKILWAATGGAHSIILEADYLNALQEVSKTNNSGTKDINMAVPETTLRILKKDAESGEFVVGNQFAANETVYFEVQHGYPDAKIIGVIEDTEENLYRAVAQGGMLSFNTGYYTPGTYKGYLAVVDKKTSVILDEVEGAFEILPTKVLKSITASPNPKRATVEENVVLKMMGEVVNGSNESIPGTLTFSLVAPSGAKAFEDKVHEVTIQPLHRYFRYTHPEFQFAFAEVGDYTLTTTLVTELGTLTHSATIPVYETPPVVLDPAKLDISLPLGEQIMKQIKMTRGGGTQGELYDVVFMFDTTGSYGGLVYQFGEQSQSIMDAIKLQLGDNVQFGIASFADYPFHDWGWYPDYAYRIDHPLTSNTQAIRDTFQNTNWWYNGADGPESQLEALYQLATGEGRDVDGNGSYNDMGDIIPANIGWRPGSTRIVFLGTDVDFHRAGEPVYGGGEPEEWWEKPYYYPGPTWQQTVDTLMNNGITVVGLIPGYQIQDVTNLLIDIGSVHRNGDPLTFTFDYSGAQITEEVLSAVELSASALRFTVRAVDDEMGFFAGAEPERVVIYPDEEASFELKFKGAVEPGAVDQIFTFELELVAGGGRVIGRIPVSILVPQKTPLKVTTDKPQYVIGENTQVTVNLEMTSNAMKSITSAEDLKKGIFDRANATVEPGNIVLDIAGVSTPKNQIQKGDFEDWEYWNYWKTTYAYNEYSYLEMMADVWDWDPISGSMSMTLNGNYYFWEQPLTNGDATLYQDVTVPGDAISAEMSWKDRSYGRGYNYKVQIRDRENNVLRTMFAGTADQWETTARTFDVSEYLGREIRVAFVFQPSNYNDYDWMSIKIDDVSLGVTYPGYYPTGTASLIVDAEAPVMWDKFTFEANTTAEGTNVAVRWRTADGLGNLANAEFSPATDINEVKITTTEAHRYLEVQFILSTTDDLKTPKVTKLHATYCKYSNADNARLKVVIEDQEGNQVTQLADFLPQIQLGLRQEFKYDFNTADREPGDYKAVGRLYINGELESRGDAGFKLITDAVPSLLESSVTTDKLEYVGNETVQITSRVKNTSDNANLNNLSVLVEVKNADNTILQSHTYEVNPLLKGALNDKPLQFNITNDIGIGPYTVTQTVSMAGIEPLVKTAAFTVKANVEQGKGLNGTLTPQPLTVKRMIGDLDLAVSAQNTGNVDLMSVIFKVTIYNPVTFAAIKAISGDAVAMPKSGSFNVTLPYGGKVELMPGTYPAVLTADFTYGEAAQTITLDTTGFIVTNTPPVANAGADQNLEGTALPMNIALNGSGSTDENSTDEAKRNDIASYKWTLGEQVLGTEMNQAASLGLGEHEITLTVTDNCGATGTDKVKITIVDTTIPVISDLVPVNDSRHKVVETITAKVTDSCSGVDYSTLVVKLDETVLTTTYNEGTGAISAAVPAGIADGWHNATITVSDKAGNAASAAWRFLTDATAPVISELTPANDSESEEHSPGISAKIADVLTGVDTATLVLKVNGTAVAHTWDAATGKISFNAADLTETVHNVSLTVSDQVGNQSSATWSFTVLPIAVPGITGTLTADPATVKRRIGDLALTIAANNSGNVALSNVTFTAKIFNPDSTAVLKEFSEVGQLPLQGTYSKVHPYGSKVELMPGTYPMTLTAAFTFRGENIVIPLSTGNLIVTNTAPAANAGADQSLEGTALPMSVTLNGSGSTDENSTDEAKRNDIVSYKWTLGEQVLSTEMNPAVSLGLGEHTITLTVTDTCGATGTDTVKITIADTTAPVITDIVPVNDSQHKTVATITAKITDSGSGVDYSTLVVKLGETALTTTYNEGTGVISATVPAGMADSWHNATITVSDKAGNAASAAWRFLTDATAPVISDMAPANNSESEEHSPIISAKIADVLTGVDTATLALKVNGTAVAHTWDAATGKISFNTADLTETVHNVSLTVSDQVGNQSSAAWSFTVLPVAVPGITGTLTADPATVKRRIGDLSVLATAANSGNVDLSNVTFRVKIFDTTGQTVLKEFSEVAQLPKSGSGYSKTHPYGSKVELMPGTYPMTLTAEFTFRGENIVIPLSTGNIVVTNTPPVANAGSDITVTTTVPAGAAVSLNGSASMDENSTDEAKKNDIVKYEWKKGETLLGSTETLSVNLAPGVHDLTLTVTDTCGATHSDTVKVTISLTVLPPTISDLAPAHNTITKELGLSAKATDVIWGIEWTSLVFKAGTTVLTATHDSATGVITSALPGNSADGWYDLNIFIKNQGGADATTPAWRVGLDRTPPTITDRAPAADVYSNNAQPTITAKLADAFSGVKADTIKVTIGTTELTHTYNAETGAVSATVPSALATGWHNAKIEVADNVGNTASTTWQIGVDKTPPTITGMVPASNASITVSSQEISAMLSDAHSGIKADTIVLKLNGTTVSHTYNSGTGKVLFNATGLANGAQTVNISVSDNAGNVSNATWTFNVQVPTGPAFLVFSNSKTQGIQFSGTYITINGRVHTNSSFASWSNTTNIQTVTASGQITGSGNLLIGNQQPNAPFEALPVYNFNYYVTNANHVHPNGWQIAWNETVPAGIHYVNGNVMIPHDLNANVTIVATGDIQFSATNLTVRSPDTQNRMALFSRDGAIRIYGNQCTVYGIVYAPKGVIHMGTTTKTVYGGLIGNTVENYAGTFTVSPYQQP